MKTYVVSLKRAENRREYITKHVSDLKLDYTIMDAVDGRLLTDEYLGANCDMNEVNKYRWWLTNDMIGCALSHYNVYEAFLKTDNKACFVVEDDVWLPDNIKEILAEIEKNVDGAEVVLLYHFSNKPAKLSTQGVVKILNTDLMFPVEGYPATTTAYIITRDAAQKMYNKIKPLAVGPDSWDYYYDRGCFDSFKVQYPLLVKTKHFKSTINYFENQPLKEFLSSIIDKYKIPLLYDFVKLARKRRFEKAFNHVTLTDQISPIQERILAKKK